ncbi:MAG: hypothetical protein WBW81_11555 [Methylocella sp.]
MVAAMVANGVPHIAKAMILDPKTLRKFYRESLDHATVLLCTRVARHLGKTATTGRSARGGFSMKCKGRIGRLVSASPSMPRIPTNSRSHDLLRTLK